MRSLHTLHQEFEVPEELQDVIKCFWYDKSDFGKVESSFEIMPDGYAEIVFHFGNPCSISIHGDFLPLPSPFIMDLLNQPAVLKTKGYLEIIGIRCFPWTVFDLLGLSPSKKETSIVEHSIAQLQFRLNECIHTNKIDDAIALVQHYFLNLQSQTPLDKTLSKAAVAMRNANGNMSVGKVAAAAHATVRTLERKFKKSSAHTVKDVSALMRFEQVRNQLWINPDSNIAALAQDIGYTDQSHLSREFKRYSDTTPAAFARKAKKNKS
ncbi:AraC family transcriptional regulator [uncultured Flavobacterium sp.]|uniref:AraC family transcriptional regulator n=1 Tax=uncultured Flavobacterium sp. TaxID=165435 RepID=UPI00292DD56A|nr:AraC family transcriptional regulator [uncultured Flavobacterium sp.]